MFFERPESGELSVLVHLDIQNLSQSNDAREFEELSLSAGADPIALLSGARASPHAKFFIGTGKLDELKNLVVENKAELVIFNHSLTPGQERNLERELKCRVLDRTGLILDIFAQRARTHEGKLQVELAQLRHMSTRLVRGWTHLERQKGGIGLRGPGETQLETDRRLLRARIKTIEKRLEKVRKQRAQGRRSRARSDIDSISLVGYTNAGKSTLFNALTSSEVYAEDQLFATLDPTMRRIEVPNIGPAIIADTVGFISHLPHRLVEAFRATLEEAASADLLLHVVDSADPERLRNVEQVQEVLSEIGAGDIQQLCVFNKTDLLQNMPPRIDRDENGKPIAVWVSAMKNQGFDLLYRAVSELLGEKLCSGCLRIASGMERLRARLYQAKAVVGETYLDDGSSEIKIRLPEADFNRILASESFAGDQLQWAGINGTEKSGNNLLI